MSAPQAHETGSSNSEFETLLFGRSKRTQSKNRARRESHRQILFPRPQLQMSQADQKLIDLRMLWQNKSKSLVMPAWGHFANKDLRPWLGNLTLIEVQSRTVRLCGTNVIPRFGRDATGRSFDELQEAVTASLMSYVTRLVSAKLPAEDAYCCIIDGYLTTFKELALPLSDDGSAVNLILLGSYLEGARPAWR
jgi:hypothetical protein